MAVAHVETSGSYDASGPQSSRNYTLDASVDCLVWWNGHYPNSSSSRKCTAAAYNGDSLTEAVYVQYSGEAMCQLWYLVNPDTGSSYALTSTFDSGFQDGEICYVGLSGVDQSDPLGSVGELGGATSSSSIDVTGTTADGHVVDGISTYNSNPAEGAGQTDYYTENRSYPQQECGISGEDSNGGTVTMSWSGLGGEFAHAAAEFLAATAGGAGIEVLRRRMEGC